MDNIVTLMLIGSMLILFFSGVVFTITVLWSSFRKKTINRLIPFTIMMGAVITMLIIILYDSIPKSPDSGAMNLIDQFAIISLIGTLVALAYNPWQAYQSEQHNDGVIARLGELEKKIDELKPQDLSPEGNSGKKIIPSELQEDGDTKIITTQYESDNVTVTSTITVTFRRE